MNNGENLVEMLPILLHIGKLKHHVDIVHKLLVYWDRKVRVSYHRCHISVVRPRYGQSISVERSRSRGISHRIWWAWV